MYIFPISEAIRKPKTVITRMGETTFLVHPEHGVYGFQGKTVSEEGVQFEELVAQADRWKAGRVDDSKDAVEE